MESHDFIRDDLIFFIVRMKPCDFTPE